MNVRDNDTITAVYFRRDAAKECTEIGFTPEAVASTLCVAWKNLRATRGSKLRALSGTADREFRLRMHKTRTVFSVIRDSLSELCACVHLVGDRDSVYERPAFKHRITEFHKTRREGGDNVGAGHYAYEPVTIESGHAEA